MNHDQQLNNVLFDRFDLKQSEEYRKALRPENALLFRKSADLFGEVARWLEGEFPGGEFVAAKGKGPISDAVIVLPKASGEINRDFSKDVHESKLAKRKSKLGPQ